MEINHLNLLIFYLCCVYRNCVKITFVHNKPSISWTSVVNKWISIQIKIHFLTLGIPKTFLYMLQYWKLLKYYELNDLTKYTTFIHRIRRRTWVIKLYIYQVHDVTSLRSYNKYTKVYVNQKASYKNFCKTNFMFLRVLR